MLDWIQIDNNFSEFADSITLTEGYRKTTVPDMEGRSGRLQEICRPLGVLTQLMLTKRG